LSGSASYPSLNIDEYSGVTSFDKSSYAEQYHYPGETFDSGSATTTHNGELIVGYSASGTATVGSGFTALPSTGANMNNEYQIQSVAGSISTPFTVAGGSPYWAQTTMMTFAP
jgi:hypothetical protein